VVKDAVGECEIIATFCDSGVGVVEVLGANMDVTDVDGIDTGVVIVVGVHVKVVAILNKGTIVDNRR